MGFFRVKSMPQTRPWMIAFSCFWINLFIFAMFRSGGVLYLELTRTFNCSHSQASWPITLVGAVTSITCLPAGFLAHYFAVRTIVTSGTVIVFLSISSCFYIESINVLIVVLGLFQGIGIGFITGLLPVIISEYFDKDIRAGAVGLSYSGAAVGAFIFPLIFESLLSSFRLQTSLLFMGGITLLSIMGALSLTPFEDSKRLNKLVKVKNEEISVDSSSKTSVKEDSEVGKGSQSLQPIDHTLQKELNENNSVLFKIKHHMTQDVRIMINPYFILITLVYIAYIMGNVTLLMILPDFAMEAGLSKSQGIILLSVFSVTDLLGRLTPLVLNYFDNDKKKSFITSKFLFVTSISMLSVILFLFPIIGNSTLYFIDPIKSFMSLYYLFLVMTLIAGFFSGFQMILPPVLLSEYLGPSQTAVAFGLSNFICGVLSFSRPFIINEIRYRTNSYDLIFYTFASFAAFSSLCWIMEIFWSWRSEYNQINNKS